MTPLTVSILPSHPSEGWLSMNRYWDALMRCAKHYEGDSFNFQCPLELTQVWTPREASWKRVFHKTISYPWKLRTQASYDVAHILDHSYAFLIPHLQKGVRSVVTVHDLLPLREPEDLTAAAIRRYRARIEWIKKADLILSDSEATKSDLIDLINVRRESIEVLPLGAETNWQSTVPTAGGSIPTNRFLLNIGSHIKRKNLEILPAVLQAVRQSHPDVTLVRAGGSLSSTLMAEFEQRCGTGSVVEFGRVDDNTLAQLYRNAIAVLVPSTYEGFGLPVLEGMAFGAPVVCSNTTSLPEVGGECALYFDPHNPNQAASQIMKLLEGTALWINEVKQRGLQRASNFTWNIHFSRLLDIYGDLASGARSVSSTGPYR